METKSNQRKTIFFRRLCTRTFWYDVALKTTIWKTIRKTSDLLRHIVNLPDMSSEGNNAPELMQVACKWDMVSWTRGIVPDRHKISFQRPVTLGLEGMDCEFIFDRLDKQGR